MLMAWESQQRRAVPVMAMMVAMHRQPNTLRLEQMCLFRTDLLALVVVAIVHRVCLVHLLLHIHVSINMSGSVKMNSRGCTRLNDGGTMKSRVDWSLMPNRVRVNLHRSWD